METDLEQWLPRGARTLDSAPDVPRALYERLTFVSGLLAEAGPLPEAPLVLYRAADGSVRWRTITGELVAGREKPADLVIEDRRLSRRHFRIAVEKAAASIEDLGSRNGTYVNSRKVSSTELKDGDLIEAGAQVLVFLQRSDTE